MSCSQTLTGNDKHLSLGRTEQRHTRHADETAVRCTISSDRRIRQLHITALLDAEADPRWVGFLGPTYQTATHHSSIRCRGRSKGGGVHWADVSDSYTSQLY